MSENKKTIKLSEVNFDDLIGFGIYDVNNRIKFSDFPNINFGIVLSDVTPEYESHRKHIGNLLTVREYVKNVGYVATDTVIGGILFSINPNNAEFKTYLNGHEIVSDKPVEKPDPYEIINKLRFYDISTEFNELKDRLFTRLLLVSQSDPDNELLNNVNAHSFNSLLLSSLRTHILANAGSFVFNQNEFIDATLEDPNFRLTVDVLKQNTRFSEVETSVIIDAISELHQPKLNKNCMKL